MEVLQTVAQDQWVQQGQQDQQDHNHLFQQAATVLCKILAQDKQRYNRATAV